MAQSIMLPATVRRDREGGGRGLLQIQSRGRDRPDFSCPLSTIGKSHSRLTGTRRSHYHSVGSTGTVLASADNYFAGDPLLHYRFDGAGEYYLEIRDTRYGGNPYWQYCIEIKDRPFVTNVHPLRVTPGRADPAAPERIQPAE